MQILQNHHSETVFSRDTIEDDFIVHPEQQEDQKNNKKKLKSRGKNPVLEIADDREQEDDDEQREVEQAEVDLQGQEEEQWQKAGRRGRDKKDNKNNFQLSDFEDEEGVEVLEDFDDIVDSDDVGDHEDVEDEDDEIEVPQIKVEHRNKMMKELPPGVPPLPNPYDLDECQQLLNGFEASRSKSKSAASSKENKAMMLNQKNSALFREDHQADKNIKGKISSKLRGGRMKQAADNDNNDLLSGSNKGKTSTTAGGSSSSKADVKLLSKSKMMNKNAYNYKEDAEDYFEDKFAGEYFVGKEEYEDESEDDNQYEGYHDDEQDWWNDYYAEDGGYSTYKTTKKKIKSDLGCTSKKQSSSSSSCSSSVVKKDKNINNFTKGRSKVETNMNQLAIVPVKQTNKRRKMDDLSTSGQELVPATVPLWKRPRPVKTRLQSLNISSTIS